MTRQHKTPRQRAEEALAVAERQVDRLGKKRDELQDELRVVVHELNAATVRRDYLAEHPDLPQPPELDTHPATTTEGAATA